MTNPVGRPSKFKQAYCAEVVNHMAEGASLTSFAAEIGVARATLNVWMEEHPEFLDAVGRAKAKCAAWWELQGRKIAVNGGGPGASTLAIFGMKNMGGDDWQEKSSVDLSNPDGSMRPTVVKIVAADVRSDD
ncbi:putative terminase small subunit [Sphingobium sp. SYK-6]|uniref:putative terminase small subunit n=1 Tax=Sphingobium sp. (strain NBRC 103272 / SYK-6) TaxID=627192 RepID=UPI00022770C2|nr:putative terminase small subunit [Sphingobium sp. SYK-6]BAK66874.1 putative terminase small subunit [Sphingobium sp. SYK-6]